MRPVLLEMNGFASFREAASVDFTDADYFVLVGPTGSGKSTVIDAMAFALYGTVPRWNDKRMVMYALAPTAVRGTVRLVFDVDGLRYVAARELRRSKQGVQVKSARLERLVDPAGTGTLSEETEVLAADSQVTGAVEELLGLTFENFCQCVVLPQGEFAEFLRAKGSDRRNILMKLLGADLYQAIGREANTRASLAGQRATMLTEQLTGLGDATPDAETAAAARESALRGLTDRVGAVVPQLSAAALALQQAQQRCDQLAAEHETLSAMRLPDGVAALDEALAAAQAAAAEARRAEGEAETADTAARDRLAVAPQRGPLEQARRDHAEHARTLAAVPAARADVEAATALLRQAAQARTAAAAGLQIAREARDAATVQAGTADAEVARLGVERGLLSAVTIPDGLSELDRRIREAGEALTTAGERVTAAELRDATARDALRTAPQRAPLETAVTYLTELAQAVAGLPPLEQAQQHAATEHLAALATADAASTAVDAARATRDDIAVAHRAAALRPHLSIGDACPVCDQTVATLPPPLHAPQLAAADKAVTAAETAARKARAAQTVAASTAATATAQLSAATAHRARLQAALDGRPADIADIRHTLRRLDGLEADVRGAADALGRARTAHTAAQTATRQLDGEVAALRTALRTVRDPLVALSAPALDDIDLLGAWTLLAGWAQQQAAARDAALLRAKTAAGHTRSAELAARAAFTAADTEAAASDTAHTEAAAARERAVTALGGLDRRIDELAEALRGAPSDADAQAQLGKLDELGAAVRGADETLRGARAARVQAEKAAEALTQDAAAVWQVLRATRDRLVPFGAPELPEGSALAGWATLLTWSSDQADQRAAALPAAQDAVLAATQHQDETAKRLTDEFAAHDVVLLPGELTSTAPVAAAAALAQARAERTRISERRALATRLTADLTNAHTDQQVAKLLGDLLRSNKFPEWLETAALDTLVIDASTNLAELSGGQFELTHRRGEFFVIDHADADSLRSVRTLSGGETFQASLALALALSAQLTSLAATGAARLDSIFLDEGFGTLDEATLETVAETLENLAHGDRMVGVITHVAALAERVPVRFAVHRDQRTSSVVRETA